MTQFGPELNPSPPQRRANALTVMPQTRVLVYQYRECISIYLPLSYLLRYLALMQNTCGFSKDIRSIDIESANEHWAK